MRSSSKPLPKDPNQLAAEIVRLSTEETETVHDYLAQIERKGGLRGGKARAQALPASKRKALAQKAAKARWSKKQV
jgi:hypothetical protein